MQRFLDWLIKRFGDRTVAIGLVGLPLLVLVSLSVLAMSNAETHGDVDLYHKYSLSILQGKVPYRDFLVEYPPLALLPMLLPQLLNGWSGYSAGSYLWLFLAQNLLLSVSMGVLLNQIAAGWQSITFSRRVWIAYLLFAIVNAPLLLLRYDAFPACLTLLALWAVMAQRPLWAGSMLGLGVAAKLYPVVLIPIFGVYYCVKRQYGALLCLIAGATVAVGFVLLLLLPIGLDHVFGFMQYHSLRGLQIESSLAGLLLLGHKLGWITVEVVLNYGAFHLKSPLADAIAHGLPVASLLLSLVAIGYSVRRFQQPHQSSYRAVCDRLVVSVVAILLVFVVTNKVFSAQYLIWILPFAPLLRPRQLVLFLFICLASSVIYPYAYGRLLNLQLNAILLLNARNLMVVVLTYGLVVERLPQFPHRQPGSVLEPR